MRKDSEASCIDKSLSLRSQLLLGSQTYIYFVFDVNDISYGPNRFEFSKDKFSYRE